MLQGIDYTGKPIGNIDFIEASWDRNWSEAGDFMVYMALAEYNRLNALGIKYVKNVGTPNLNRLQLILAACMIYHLPQQRHSHCRYM